MKNLIMLLVAALLNSAVLGQTPDEQALRHLKEVLWPKAYREQDTNLLDQILADEFQMIDSEGNWSTKEEEMEYIKSNKPSYESFRYDIKRLEVFENNTAVIAGIGYVRGNGDDGAYLVTYHSSNILIKRGSQWKAISSHVSGVKRSTDES